MHAKPGPKGHMFTAVEDETVHSNRSSYGASLEEENAGEPVLLPGWWILPCALGGLIECYVIVKWLIANL